jgi:hypothetical protein
LTIPLKKHNSLDAAIPNSNKHHREAPDINRSKRRANKNAATEFKLYRVFHDFRALGITAGGDFLGLCDEKSSYKHVSDFGRLRSYDLF